MKEPDFLLPDCVSLPHAQLAGLVDNGAGAKKLAKAIYNAWYTLQEEVNVYPSTHADYAEIIQWSIAQYLLGHQTYAGDIATLYLQEHGEAIERAGKVPQWEVIKALLSQTYSALRYGYNPLSPTTDNVTTMRSWVSTKLESLAQRLEDSGDAKAAAWIWATWIRLWGLEAPRTLNVNTSEWSVVQWGDEVKSNEGDNAA